MNSFILHMTRFDRISFVCLLTFFLLNNIAAAKDDWKLEKNDKGIQVYTRLPKGSDFKSYKAHTLINAKRDKVEKMVLGIEHYIKWFPDCLESKVVERRSENEIVVYYKIASPWPAEDRDAVVRLEIERDDQSTLINFEEEDGIVPLKDEAVRIPKTKGYWKFTDKEEFTSVEYMNEVDPGGSVPAWISNLFVVDAPFETLLAMRSLLH